MHHVCTLHKMGFINSVFVEPKIILDAMSIFINQFFRSTTVTCMRLNRALQDQYFQAAKGTWHKKNNTRSVLCVAPYDVSLPLEPPHQMCNMDA